MGVALSEFQPEYCRQPGGSKSLYVAAGVSLWQRTKGSPPVPGVRGAMRRRPLTTLISQGPISRVPGFVVIFWILMGVRLCWAVEGGEVPRIEFQQIARGVYVHYGHIEETSPENLGDIANIGFIVGSRCVAVIDTGGSIWVGRALSAAVNQITHVPVCYVINSHVHPDHIFGNAAFQGVQPPPIYVGHEKLPAAMMARKQTYLNALARVLGAKAAGTEVILPTLLVRHTMDIDLGGRILKLHAWRTAHTDSDLTVFDEQTGTMWLSDLLFVDHVPVVDGNLKGWIKVVGELQAFHPQRVVPGHGRIMSAWRQALDKQQRYLNTLLVETRSAIERRLTLRQAVAEVGQSEKDKWRLFDSFHRRSVTAAYVELEWDED